MKRTLTALVASVALGSAGIAGAATTGLLPFSNSGVTCLFGNGPQGKGVACIQSSGKGYAVTLTHTKVVVWINGRSVFQRHQP
jgi:hypothetical protein